MKSIQSRVFSPDLICSLDDGCYVADFVVQTNESENAGHALQFSVPESIENKDEWERLMVHYGMYHGLIGRPCYVIRNKRELKCFERIQRTVDSVAIYKL